MSQSNVDVVVRSWDVFAEGGLDAMEECWHPEINWRAVEGAVDDHGELQGRAAKRAYYADWVAMFEEIRCRVDEVLFDEGELVGVRIVTAGRPHGSDAWAEGRHCIVYTVRDGLIVRGREYVTPEAARAAAGVGG
jgi:ketosteroid isomerase-like protein